MLFKNKWLFSFKRFFTAPCGGAFTAPCGGAFTVEIRGLRMMKHNLANSNHWACCKVDLQLRHSRRRIIILLITTDTWCNVIMAVLLAVHEEMVL